MRVAPGAPRTRRGWDAPLGRLFAVDDGRCHAGGAAFAGRDRVWMAGQRVEVDHRVVVHEAEAGGDDAG